MNCWKALRGVDPQRGRERRARRVENSTHWVISSQAARTAEGSTTIPQGSRAQVRSKRRGSSTVEQRCCTKCGKKKQTSEFYSGRPDCKECKRACSRNAWTSAYGEQRNVARRGAYQRLDLKQKNASRAYHRVKSEEYRARHPERVAARYAVLNAVKRGTLPPVNRCACADCGRAADSYHHEDYSRALDVVALCRLCHEQRETRGRRS